MSGAHEDHVLTTYRSLRAGTIPLLLILVVAPVLETFRGQVCVLGSISAYFYTPVRGAFVLALAGVGVSLIAYKGNDALEDVLLNFAGFMAFVVALVPTTVDTNCVAKYGNVVADANMADAVRNNVLTLFLMSVLAVGLYRLLPRLVAASRRRADLGPTPDLPSKDDGDRSAKLARVLRVVAWGTVVGELALFGFWPDMFKDLAHGISAITMVVGVIAVMVANAWGFARATGGSETPPAEHWRNRYTVTAATTVALVAVAIVTLHASQHLILVIELIVIVGFAVFWFIQTRELWDYPTRVQKLQKVDQEMEKVNPQRQPESGGTEQPSSPPSSEPPSPAETAKSRSDVYRAL